MKVIYSFDNNIFYHTKWEDRSVDQKFTHSLIFPKNTYSPWKSDPGFLEIYNQIQGNTLVDQFRCFELWHIALQLKKMKGDILEIGVWRGGTGAVLAKASGSDTMVFLCDTFEGVVKAGKNDNIYTGGEHSDTSSETVIALMKKMDIENYRIVKGIFPDESGNQVNVNVIKLCHIDVDVYESAKDIFEWVWPKIAIGGIVIFDDYGFAACEGITTLVNELTLSREDALMIYNINGHGHLVKIR